MLCCVCFVAELCATLCNPMDCSLPGFSVHGDSLGKNTEVGCRALLQGIFPAQGSNSGLPHCRWILYHLSHQGSPRILEWVAYPFSRRTSQPRNRIGVSCIARGSLSTMITMCNLWHFKKVEQTKIILQNMVVCVLRSFYCSRG